MIVVGCDPELMVADKKSGELRSAIGIVPGTKDKPHDIVNGALLCDNVNLEFNTKPAKTATEFRTVIKQVLKQAVKAVGTDYKLLVQASANFPVSQLQDAASKEFGCDPDFDAYTISMNHPPRDAGEDTFRSAGGHIHIGFTKKTKELLDDMEGKIRVIKSMDLVVGITSVLLDKDPTSTARRKLYGKAGCHRVKSYGVEYRAIGNYWFMSPKYVDIVYALTHLAVEMCMKNEDTRIFGIIGEEVVRNTVSENDAEMAKRIYTDFIVPNISASLKGKIDTLIGAAPKDFYKEWGL